jgi:RNA polymerase sigma factor (sigma-70 family)
MTAQPDVLAERFEAHRARVRAVAYRLLGSLSDADDAVQESWLRLSRAESTAINELGAWLTTVVARICLDMLRMRKTRREDPLDAHVPDPVVSRPDGSDPEAAALLADSVGLALIVVLDTLAPAERIALVLHDAFAVPFVEIARILDRSPNAVAQLASRARRRVLGAATPDADVARHREVVDAFVAAARAGDLNALIAVLDPDVVFRYDGGTAGTSNVVRGAAALARQAVGFARLTPSLRPILVNGDVGVAGLAPDGLLVSITGFTVRGGRIVEIDALADPVRLRGLRA